MKTRKLKLGIGMLLAIGGAIASCCSSVLAQLTPDRTLGAENSVVKPLDSHINRVY